MRPLKTTKLMQTAVRSRRDSKHGPGWRSQGGDRAPMIETGGPDGLAASALVDLEAGAGGTAPGNAGRWWSAGATRLVLSRR
jgi:hypothetical protein